MLRVPRRVTAHLLQLVCSSGGNAVGIVRAGLALVLRLARLGNGLIRMIPSRRSLEMRYSNSLAGLPLHLQLLLLELELVLLHLVNELIEVVSKLNFFLR